MMLSRLRDYVIYMSVPLLVAVNLPLGRGSVAVVPPWTLACLRWWLATLIFLPFAWKALGQNTEAIKAEWRFFPLLAFLGMWVCGGVVYMSLRYTTATHATLIYTSSTIIVVIVAAIMARRAIPLTQIVGILLAITGVAMTASHGDLRVLLDLDFNIGDLGVFAAAISWAIYSLLIKRPSLEAIPTSATLWLTMICGALLLTPFMIYELATQGGFPTTTRAWMSIIGLALFPAVLAYSAYQYSVRKVGPTVTSIIMYLSPGYAIAFAVLFLGEQFQFYHVVCLLLLVGGVALATGAGMIRRRPTAENAPAQPGVQQ